MTDKDIEALWDKFSDIAYNPETETIEEPFMHFKEGTDKEDIWYWFDENHSKGVAYLLYDYPEDKDKEKDINYVDKLVDVAKALGYKVESDNLYISVEINGNIGTPHNVKLVDYLKAYEGEYTYRQAAELMIDELKTHCAEFDVSSETKKRLNEEGHGVEGEPYDKNDVYKCVCTIGNNMEKLYRCLYDAYYNDCFERYIQKNKSNNKDIKKKSQREVDDIF